MSYNILGNDAKKTNLDLSENLENLSRVHITSGSRTYRLPSPTRTHMPINQNSFNDSNTSVSNVNQDATPNTSDKGFYVSFDEEDTPKRPKPPFRKRNQPKVNAIFFAFLIIFLSFFYYVNLQDRNLTQVLNNSVSLKNIDISPKNSNSFSTNKSKEFPTPVKSASEPAVMQSSNNQTNHTKVSTPTGVELIIENSTPDPV